MVAKKPKVSGNPKLNEISSKVKTIKEKENLKGSAHDIIIDALTEYSRGKEPSIKEHYDTCPECAHAHALTNRYEQKECKECGAKFEKGEPWETPRPINSVEVETEVGELGELDKDEYEDDEEDWIPPWEIDEEGKE